MYRKQIKCLKWQKIALVGLMTIITLFGLVLPSFAATSGVGGDNFPEIQQYLEIHYTDGKSSFTNITDRYYLSNRVQGSTTIMTGVPDIRIRPVGISIGSDSVASRKSIYTQNGANISGFTITAPTFYLTKAEGVTSFDQTPPRVNIPVHSYAVIRVSYDVYMGGTSAIAHVERDVTSSVGVETRVDGVTYADIMNNVPALNDFTSVCIQNFKMTTTRYAFSETSGGDLSALGGQWTLNEDIDPYIPASESTVTIYFPFESAGTRFLGMTFDDGLKLLYADYDGVNDTAVDAWTSTRGWINEEYRTIVVDDGVEWSDVEYYNSVEAGASAGESLQSWLKSNASKNSETGIIVGDVFTYLYRTCTLNHINDAWSQYISDYGDIGSGSWQAGFTSGYDSGKNEGYEIGYQAALDEQNPDLTGWLSTAVGGILGFEILPNITFLAIIGVLLTISLTIALLKFFAGG